MHGRIVCLGLVVGLVAGCVEPPSAPSAAASIVFDEATGAIEGRVVDDALAPVQGVLVGLDGGNQTITDEAGGFDFSRVPPGPHAIQVQGIGIEPKELRLEVVAGERHEVSITVIRVAAEVPYHQTSIHDGVTFCGTSVRQPGQPRPGYLQICGVLYYYVSQDLDKFRIDYDVPMKGFVGFFGETAWVKNSAASGGYNVIWGMIGSDGSVPTLARNGSGKSPLVFRIERALFEPIAKNPVVTDCKMETRCHIASFHANYGETLGPSAPVDAAVSFQQRYKVYFTTFYYSELPLEFTAVGDS